MDEYLYNKFEMICTNPNDNTYHIIEKYLKFEPELVTHDESYFFKLVAITGKIDLVKLFIKYGANIFDDDHTVLYICAHRKYYDIMDYLLELGENIENIKYNDGYREAKQYLNELNE